MEGTLSKRKKVIGFLKAHLPFLFDPMSVFYFAIFIILLSMGWMAYCLFTNEFTQLLNWDYTWQFVPFAYDYYDSWKTFFSTGHFPLYDGGTFMGTDNIGSGSYYGLFDPFVVALIFFPRSFIPQAYAILTFLRFAVSALLMRCYLKYLGCKEWTARIGAVAYAFSGFATYMSGFPNVLTATVYVPMILWGIERVLKERKPGVLIWGLFLEGITSFFYLVVVCIWGVAYALWRYFQGIRSRTKKENLQAMGLGVAAFALGLCLCAFTVLPSIRESALSGRASSIGSAYLQAIKDSLKSHDFASFFSLIFEEVGDNPGRELMGLISFFFPTGGFTRLPMATSGYDAWTASLFCYTPIAISFVMAIFHSLRLRKWNHIVAILICVYLCFTNLAYFLFYAFSGNGYGRWFIILVPAIIAYGCWGFDQQDQGSKIIPLASSILVLAGTVISYYVICNTLSGVNFSSYIYNVHGTTYWQTTYQTADTVHDSVFAAWYFYYQLAIIFIEGTILCVGYRKTWTPKALFGILCFEVVMMGNLTYAWNGTWSYLYSFAGGKGTLDAETSLAQSIKEQDSSFYRVHNELAGGNSYINNLAGYNSAISFHSLMNFDVDDFAYNNRMKNVGSTSKTYGDVSFYNPSWSGSYRHKRFAADMVMAYRYNIIENRYSGYKDPQGNPYFFEPNVPFGSEQIQTKLDNTKFRVYKLSEHYLPSLGYAVESDNLYYIGHDKEKSQYETSFFHNLSNVGGYREIIRSEEVELFGAMIEDNEVLPGFNVKKEVPSVGSDVELNENYGTRYSDFNRRYRGHGLTATYIETGVKAGDLLIPDSSTTYASKGLAYFLDPAAQKVNKEVSGYTDIVADYGKLVFHNNGAYLNTDPRGAYFEFHYYNATELGPRVYAIGDKFDENGTLVETDAVLSFDNLLIDNVSHSSFWNSSMTSFGLYARGKVKYLAFCFPGYKEKISVNISDFYYLKKEYGEIMDSYAYMTTNRLLDVKGDVNTFTFKTSYDQDRIVVTSLGYDKGWGGTITYPDGKKEALHTMKLDGGLVGFVAKGSQNETGNDVYTYELRYDTPYSKLSLLAWFVGTLGFGALTIVPIVAKKKKKELAA